jgi:hypothetical protein
LAILRVELRIHCNFELLVTSHKDDNPSEMFLQKLKNRIDFIYYKGELVVGM